MFACHPRSDRWAGMACDPRRVPSREPSDYKQGHSCRNRPLITVKIAANTHTHTQTHTHRDTERASKHMFTGAHSNTPLITCAHTHIPTLIHICSAHIHNYTFDPVTAHMGVYKYTRLHI